MGSEAAVDRKAELLAKRAEREKADAARVADYELQVLELEEKFSADGSRRGQQFEILELDDIAEPPIVLRVNFPGVRAVQKAFTSSKQEDADADALAVACLVHPSPEDFRAIIGRRPLVMDYVLATVSKLLGGTAALRQKKR